MTELEVILPHKGEMPSEAVVEAMVAAGGLRVTFRGTLAQYPGCIHWHLKKGSERGVLELTCWPRNKRVWFSMQDGRQGDWVMPAAKALKAELENGI